MNIEDKQRKRLKATIQWARRIRSGLQSLLDAHGDRVHFRPSSRGFAMVGLLEKAPQLGKPRLRNINRVVREFETLFDKHCTSPPRRSTPEKALQSFLIRDAHAHQGKMAAISQASLLSNDPVTLAFVTDEISLPVEGKQTSGRDSKVVCDVLAYRGDLRTGIVPIIMELKPERAMTRLIEQATDYANLMDKHPRLFEELYSALLGGDIHFTTPTEKWAVWPADTRKPDRREAEFASHGIRLVSYEPVGERLRFPLWGISRSNSAN